MTNKKLITVLIYSNNVTRRGLLKKILLSEFSILAPSSLKEAVDYLTNTKVQAAILDDETMEELRPNIESHLETNWIVVTKHIKKSYTQELRRLGIQQILYEPIEEEEVKAALLQINTFSKKNKLSPLSRKITPFSKTTHSLKSRFILDNKALKQVSVCLDSGIPLSLLVIEIQLLDEVKETWGLLVSEELMMLIQHEISQQIRTQDILSTLGGDHFVLILPKTSQSAAQAIAGNLIDSLEKKMFSTQKVSLSIQIKVGGSSWLSKELHEEKKAYEALDILVKSAQKALSILQKKPEKIFFTST